MPSKMNKQEIETISGGQIAQNVYGDQVRADKYIKKDNSINISNLRVTVSIENPVIEPLKLDIVSIEIDLDNCSDFYPKDTTIKNLIKCILDEVIYDKKDFKLVLINAEKSINNSICLEKFEKFILERKKLYEENKIKSTQSIFFQFFEDLMQLHTSLESEDYKNIFEIPASYLSNDKNYPLDDKHFFEYLDSIGYEYCITFENNNFPEIPDTIEDFINLMIQLYKDRDFQIEVDKWTVLYTLYKCWKND